MDELVPNVKQRFCVRHLYNNIRNKYHEKLLKEIIRKDAKSTYPRAWEREMNGMRLVNEDAFKSATLFSITCQMLFKCYS